MWNWTCPICGKRITEDYEVEEIKEYVGATHECPECNGVLMIEDDCTCSDFGKELEKRYCEAKTGLSNGRTDK